MQDMFRPSPDSVAQGKLRYGEKLRVGGSEGRNTGKSVPVPRRLPTSGVIGDEESSRCIQQQLW